MSVDLAEPETIRRPSRTSLALLGSLLLLRTVLLFAGDGIAAGVVAALGAASPWRTALAWSDLTVVAVDLITLAVLVRLCRREGRRLRDLLGVVRLRRDLPVGLLVAVPLLAALLVGTYVGNLVVWGGPPPTTVSAGLPPVWLGVWAIVVMPVTVAAAEELLYRGLLLPRLAERWGWWPAALVVSLAFGLQHAAFSATSVPAVIARVIATTLAGLVFALLARKLGRLLPLVVGHWLVDVLGLGLPLLLLSVGVGAR